MGFQLNLIATFCSFAMDEWNEQDCLNWTEIQRPGSNLIARVVEKRIRQCSAKTRAVCALSEVDNRLDKSFGVEEMQVQIESDYAKNAGKTAGSFKALGCKRGIIRLSACRQLLRGFRTHKENAPFHGALRSPG